ncbi:copper homeostasis protein CutC [Oryzobacter terrae]|uniref:copper homeostasis protein CutC n=1 Tax=Oryzobacter terrae TaxID=1620385 RepID=UPI00366D485C
MAGAVAAERAGADRVEVCADLDVGGVTPSIGTVASVLARTSRVGVQVLVRPRGGDFVHDEAEVAVMLADVAAVLALPAGVPVGLVIGSLTTDGRVDEEATARLVAAAGGAPVTFHRAFDDTADLSHSLETLVRLGVDRVLTGGGPGSAAEGTSRLASLHEQAAGRIVVLAAGGVRPGNVRTLVRDTGVGEVHGRAPATVAGRVVTSEDVARTLVEACREPFTDPLDGH